MRITRTSRRRNGLGTLQAWRYTADAPRGAVFLCPALAGRAGAYDAFSRYLCRLGLNVWVPQYRLDAGLSLRDWAVGDTTAALHEFLDSAGTLPKYAVGHSFGGLFLGLAAENTRFEKLLLVASPRANVWTFGLRAIPSAAFNFYLKVPLLWRFRREVSLEGIGLEGRVPARIAADCARLIRSVRFDHALEELALPTSHFEGFTGELLSLCFSDDPLATAGPTRSLALSFKNAACREVRHIDPAAFHVPRVAHLGFFHRQCQERLWPALVDRFLSFG